jgi:hypothetical protein
MVSDIKQTAMYTAKPLVPDPSPFKVVIVVAEVRRCRVPNKKQRSKDIPVTGHGGLWGCEVLKIPHC